MEILFENKLQTPIDGEVYLDNISAGTTVGGSIILSEFTTTQELKFIPTDSNYRTYVNVFTGNSDDVWNDFTIKITRLDDADPLAHYLVVQNICGTKVSVYLTSVSAYTHLSYVDTLGNIYTTKNLVINPIVQEFGLNLILENCIKVSNAQGCISGIPPEFFGIEFDITTLPSGLGNFSIGFGSDCSSNTIVEFTTTQTTLNTLVQEIIDEINQTDPANLSASSTATGVKVFIKFDFNAIKNCNCLPRVSVCSINFNTVITKYPTCEDCNQPGILIID
jgi:hypothetical protein